MRPSMANRTRTDRCPMSPRARSSVLFEHGRATSEVARMVGMHAESVRRWKRLWEQGGAQALRRRPATGRPPKLDDAQVEASGRVGARRSGAEHAPASCCGAVSGAQVVIRQAGCVVSPLSAAEPVAYQRADGLAQAGR
ncbi:helix-turn-helix domain-containing protein [Streptomyces pseudovenezuelae]|uniref:helix-turn-helix domain-containing protein n=1 Tax=Streptomyces pseudovenezuelae TaxID=67350 RepID=UPI0034A2F75F